MPDTVSLAFTPADIDESASVPLYQQIYDLLRAKIMDGTMSLNNRLPAEQDLTQAGCRSGPPSTWYRNGRHL